MTKDEWLKRCATVYDAGLATNANLFLMQRWLDAVMRFEYTLFSGGQSQGRLALEFINQEYARTDCGTRTLAGDKTGYALQQIAAIFAHPCQQCAEDANAWHTRPGFCPHKEPYYEAK